MGLGFLEHRLEGRARELTPDDVPAEWRSAPVVHLAPVAWEMRASAMAAAFSPGQLFATPQGWLRRADAAGDVEADVLGIARVPFAGLRASVLSVDDAGGDLAVLERIVPVAPCLVLTRGAAGCTLYASGQPTDLPALPAREVDSVGAGDVFAAAFFVRLVETNDPLGSARFATAAAACAIEGAGWHAIPTRAEVLARLASAQPA